MWINTAFSKLAHYIVWVGRLKMHDLKMQDWKMTDNILANSDILRQTL